MDCRQAFDIDLAGFLDAPRASEFDAFRAHYPRCAACAAEVRAWTELHAELSAGVHPTAAVLAGYAQLPAAERAAIDRHSEACPTCREELRLLDAFDPAAFAQPAPAAAPVRERNRRGWMESLAQLLWHPAFAYGVAILVIVPILWRTQGPGSLRDTTAVPQAVVLNERSESRADRPAARERAPERAAPNSERLAESTAPAPAAEADAIDGVEAFEAPQFAGAAAATATAPHEVIEGESAVADAAAPSQPLAAPAAPPGPEPVVQESAVVAEERGHTDAAQPDAMFEREPAAKNAASVEDDELQFAARDVAALQPRQGEANTRAVAAAEAVGFADTAAPSGSDFRAESSALGKASGERRPTLAPVVLASASRTVRVSVPVAGGAARAVAVSVRDASNTRSLLLRADAAAGSGEVAIEIERDWLTPGTYSVSVDDGPAPARAYALPVVER